MAKHLDNINFIEECLWSFLVFYFITIDTVVCGEQTILTTIFVATEKPPQKMLCGKNKSMFF
jgi:hypothetical protein